jgi:threonine dehydrogenase-like Zn-dependent dehydrogenase
MYGAGDVRVEDVPDANLIKPTDALVRVTRACIRGGDLRRHVKGSRTRPAEPRAVAGGLMQAENRSKEGT